MEYDKLDPCGDERGDLRIGKAFAKLASMFTSKQRFKPSDFMPDFSGVKARPKTGADVWGKVKGIMGRLAH